VTQRNTRFRNRLRKIWRERRRGSTKATKPDTEITLIVVQSFLFRTQNTRNFRVTMILLLSFFSGFLVTATTEHPSQSAYWDNFCQMETHNSTSYCKYYQDPSVCFGTTINCGHSATPAEKGCVHQVATNGQWYAPCDLYCSSFILPGSNCSRSGDICTGTNKRSCSNHNTAEFRHQISIRCDKYCQRFLHSSAAYCDHVTSKCALSSETSPRSRIPQISCRAEACVQSLDFCDAFCHNKNGQGSVCFENSNCTVGGQFCQGSQANSQCLLMPKQ
jgi:hypothetical protein